MEFRANIFIFQDKTRAFVCKINPWTNKIENNNNSAFQTFQTLINDDQYVDIRIEIQHNVKKNHRKKLKSEFTGYFPEWNEVNSVQRIVRNYFCAKVKEALEYLQEAVIELQNDYECKNMFDYVTHSRRTTLHIQLRKIALRHLLVFSIKHLYGQGFSSLLAIKNKHRNRLDVNDDMRLLATSNIHPRIEKLVKEMQSHKSH